MSNDADLLDVLATRLSNLGFEIDARPVIPPSYEEKSLEDITDIRELEREKVGTTDIGLRNNLGTESVEIGTQNILAVYDQATPSELEYWSHWYKKASGDVQKLAQNLGVPFELMAAVVAVTSPGNEWAMNLRAAERAVLLAADAVDDPDVGGAEKQIEDLQAKKTAMQDQHTALKKQAKKDPALNDQVAKLGTQLDALTEQIKGLVTKYGDLSRKHGRSINTYPANIRKALNVLYSEDRAKWVTGPKVSAFYASLVKPEEVVHEMVLDGHALNIFDGVKRALKEAKQADGERRRKIKEAYQAAATARNTNTRAVQAVTWYIFKNITGESSLTETDAKQLDAA